MAIAATSEVRIGDFVRVRMRDDKTGYGRVHYIGAGTVGFDMVGCDLSLHFFRYVYRHLPDDCLDIIKNEDEIAMLALAALGTG